MFIDELNKYDIGQLVDRSNNASKADVARALSSERITIDDMLALLSPAAEGFIEEMAQRSRRITLARFGKTIQLYAPIYLSNFCVNSCVYCGFKKGSKIKRRIQTPDDVVKEVIYLKGEGFRNILLVSGDDPKVDAEYLEGVISSTHKLVPSVSLEVSPRSTEEYTRLRKAGADGVTIYQETYERNDYERFHPKGGEKSDYLSRLDAPDRIAEAGFHRVGIGFLLGLRDPLYDAIAIFLHARYLIKYRWKTQVTISLPRMRHATGAIDVPFAVSDKKFTQLLCAMRIAFPDIGIIVSTREDAHFRDSLLRLGVTQISAGSKTEPGGYLLPDGEGEQFSVEDSRSPGEIVAQLKIKGYDPVWKDWEGVLND